MSIDPQMQVPPESQYKAFPFLSQVQDFVRKEIELRDKRVDIFSKTPFIKATPGYKVDNEPTPILKGIVSYGEGNTVENVTELRFSGLYNKELAFRPRAGITGLTVEYQNIVGSVRKATLSWACHSVQDLQALSKYFMHPGMTLFLEWGWSNIPSGIISINDKYGPDFKFINYFRKVRENTKLSSGRYDAMLGYIKNYSFTMRNDGGFECTTEMASAGDLMQGIILSQQKDADGSELKNTIKTPALKSIIMNYLNDVVDVAVSKKTSGTSPLYDYEHGVFVLNPKPEDWGAPDPNKKDSQPENAQLKAPRYFSWGFIEDYILTPYLSLYVDAEGMDKKALYAFDSTQSKIGIHPNLRTLDLGKCIIPLTSNSSNTIMEIVKSYMPNIVKTAPNRLQIDNIVHAKFIQVEKKADSSQDTLYTSPRNILINEDLLKSAIERSIDPLTFVSIILAEVNNTCGNYWELRLQATDGTSMEDGVARPVSTYSVVDLKYSGLQESKESIFTFRIKPFVGDANGKFVDARSSIIKTMKFTSNLSNQSALNVFYKAHQSNASPYNINGKSVLYAGLFKVDPESANPKDRFLDRKIGYLNEEIKRDPSKTYTSLDYEGDQSGYHPNLKVFLPLVQYGYSGRFVNLDIDLEPATYEFGSPKFVMDAIEILYILDARDNLRALCMFDSSDKMSSSTNDALTPMNLEMELEGISGLRPGDMFDIDNAPEVYRQAGVFQIKAVNQVVDKGMWSTKITAQYRVTKRIK